MDALFDTPIQRIGTSSIKWDRSKAKFETERDLIPLWIADTDFRAPEEVIQAIRARADHGVFGYTFAMEDYLQTVSDWYQQRHNLTIPTAWITATYGVVTALRFTIECLTDPGDQVLILTPAYEPFFEIVKNTGRTLVELELTPDQNSYSIDFDRMETCFQQGVRMVIFCNPHNPVGRVWTRHELARLTTLCAQYGVYLASDEVHGDVALFGHPYTSLAALDQAREWTLIYSSAGKPFSMTGLCASNLIIPHEPLRERVVNKIHDAWIMSPNLFGLTATKAAYEFGGPWLDRELAYLEGNSNYVREFLSQRLPLVTAADHEGTFMMWLDFHKLGLSDEVLFRRLVEVCGLGLGRGGCYGEQYGQFMRINIGCARPVLERAMEAMALVSP